MFSTKNPFSVGTYLVDGRVVGAWSLTGRRIELEPYEKLSKRDERAVEREREALEAFHAWSPAHRRPTGAIPAKVEWPPARSHQHGDRHDRRRHATRHRHDRPTPRDDARPRHHCR